jgi:two-component system CheB/CheR fusion protein
VGEVLGLSDEYAVIALSSDATITGWYGAAERLFGYTAEQIAGRSFEVLFEPGDIEHGIPHVELELTRKHGRSEDDRWHVRQDGSRIWANGVLNRQPPQGDPDGFVKLLRDRTDIRIRDEAMQSRLQRCTHQFAEHRNAHAALVHELRNSMAPVRNAAHAAASEADPALRARMHAVIGRQIEVMQRVLQSALEAQPAQAERLLVQPVVLQEALGSAVDAMRPDADAKQQSLLLVCPEVPVMIEVDRPRLQQMLINLLSNAVKYTANGGHIAVSGNLEGEMAVIRIEDDGAGIAQENLERVFELFTRESDTGPVPGFGIGLAVVKRLAWLHGGFVQARSAGKGKGSQFALQLPLKQAPR